MTMAQAQTGDGRETPLSALFWLAFQGADTVDEMEARLDELLAADRRAMAEFTIWAVTRQKRERCAAFFREHHRTVTRQVAMGTHGPVSAANAREMPERPSMPAHMRLHPAPPDTGERHRARIANVVEYRGLRLLDDVVFGVRLRAASREHLLASAETSEARARSNLASARLWRAIAGRLPEGGIVRDVLGARALGEIAAQVETGAAERAGADSHPRWAIQRLSTPAPARDGKDG